jgi:hypothetical protein
VGSGHALLALREDYRAHLEMARRDLGVKFVVRATTSRPTTCCATFNGAVSTIIRISEGSRAGGGFTPTLTPLSVCAGP